MTTFSVTGASCHTTFICMKSDILTKYHSFPKYWMQKIKKSWKKSVTTSPGLPCRLRAKSLIRSEFQYFMI